MPPVPTRKPAWTQVLRGMRCTSRNGLFSMRRVIGVLGSASYGAFPGTEAAFLEGLSATGFVESKNVEIEWRWADSQYNRLSSLTAELVGRDVAVIVAFDAPAAFAAKAATKTVPIVFFAGADPVEIGLVQSFSRPSGNLTGIYNLVAGLGPSTWSCCTSCFPQRA
jgi:putative tryptophan/tyrosine transport system substrate-binding protein